MTSQLGINTIHVDVDKIKAIGLKRAEVCLGRMNTYEESLAKANYEINYLEKNKIDYSIHLPLHLYDWFIGDYLDAYFLDNDFKKREMSFKLLESNLEMLRKNNPDYFVLHFPGVYLDIYEDADKFSAILKSSLIRLNEIARNYDVKILLEYFGSNSMFWDCDMWIDCISVFSNLGILTDTGHLYYSSLINGFDYIYALEKLAKKSEAFHLWTTKGNKPYGQNEYYKKYHHIIINPTQLKENNWAFNTTDVYKIIATARKPMIIEASPYYKNIEYFYSSIKDLIALDKKIDFEKY